MPEEPLAGNPPKQICSVLGFDFGSKKIGVASGQTVSATASALCVLPCQNDQPPWQEIANLINQWQPDALIVGLPLDVDGGEQLATRQARNFAKKLHGRTGLAVYGSDERYSTQSALDRFRDLRQSGAAKRNNISREDAVAAQIILEQWLAKLAASH